MSSGGKLRRASAGAVAYSAFAYQIHPDGYHSSQENVLKQSDSLTEVPIRGCVDDFPAMLQSTRPLSVSEKTQNCLLTEDNSQDASNKYRG